MVDGGRIVGIVSERDIIYCLVITGLKSSAGRSSSDELAGDHYRFGTSVLSALALMTQRRIRHLPVVEGGQICGIVSIGDLVKHRMERIEAEAEAMREYIQSA